MSAPPSSLVRDISEALRVARGLSRYSTTAMADAAGVGESTWYRRMTEGDWTVLELEGVATLLNVSVPDILGGPAAIARALCAARDSNPEPADYDPHCDLAMTA